MAEYFDILDKDGHLTGQTKLRSEVHRDGDWHRSIDIWVMNSKGELLIQKRSLQKESYPGLWEVSCSGHVGAGENPLESAVRELAEELGVEVSPSQLQFLFEDKEENTTNGGTFINKEFKEIYLLNLDLPIENYHLQSEEVDEVKYVPHKELEEQIKNNPAEFVAHENLYRRFFEMLD
jgi:isopentenyl-diphosphate delta-isomerase type 1